MTEYSDESRAIMRQNARAGGRRGGGGGVPIDVQASLQAMQGPQRPGLIRRLVEAMNPFDAWMGPGQPMPVVTPEGTPDRSWDYDLFFNYSYQPDAAKARESGVTMLQLKMLARQTHVALAKNRAKNKQKKKTWLFGLEKMPGERIVDVQKRALEDERVKEVADFFRMPDGENELPEWIGLNLENIFTCGVTAIVPWRNVGGMPYRLEVYDPATITPKLDASGRRPMGIDPATGQPAVAFQQYIKGVTFANFSDADLLWYGPNPVPGKVYPVGPTEALMFYINIALRKDIQRMGAYSDSNIPKGLLPMPDTWTPDQIKTWYRSFNNFVVNMPENIVKLVPIPSAGSGNNPVFPQLDLLKDTWDEPWERLCFSFYDVPVSSLVREMTHANAKSNRSQSDEEGEQYYEGVCKRLINRCIVKYFGYADVIARTEAEVETDLKIQSEIDKSRVALGLSQTNEVRERDGLEPIEELIGINGYFNTSGEFVTFASAIERSNNPPQPQAGLFGGGNGNGGSAPAPDSNAITDVSAQDEAAKFLKMARPFEYASAQVNITGDIAAQILELAASIPDDALAEKGRETDPHVTLKFGIDPSVTVAELRSAIGTGASGSLTFGVSAFFAADDYDVVALTVDSDDLKSLNAAITDAVATTKTQANYVPHVTLAYVESGRGHEFAGNGSMAGVTFNYRSVYFTDTDGNQTRIQLIGPHTRVRAAAAKLEKKKPHASPYESRTSSMPRAGS